MKKPLNDLKIELISKYGYEENFAETLSILVSSIIDHYGEEYENLVLNAILSCKYIIAGTPENKYENAYDVLKRENMLDTIVGDTIINDSDYKTASGVYQAVPRLSNTEGTFNIDRIDRIIVLPHNFDENRPVSMGILSHETLHLIKSFINQYSIEENILHERNGFYVADYELSVNEGKIEKRVLKETGMGFDEGVNTHDEYAVMNESYYDNYEASGYAKQRVIAEYILFNLNLKNIVDKAILTGEFSELKEILNGVRENGYNEFMSMMDKSIELEYERFKNILNGEKLRDATNRANEHYEHHIVPFVKDLEKLLAMEKENEKRASKSIG